MRAAAADVAETSRHAPPLPDPAKFDQGYAAVRGDHAIQFDFPRFNPPPAKPPAWLEALYKAIAAFSRWAAPAWPFLFWGLVALLVLALIVALVPSLRQSALALWRRWRRKPAPEAEAPVWQPQAEVARALLQEADALAAAGRYDEAVHLILFRSIEDIEAWRGDIVRPSLTSRDIARADALPDRARQVFARIVAAVERSLFGGRPLGRGDWDEARADYAHFALKAAA